VSFRVALPSAFVYPPHPLTSIAVRRLACLHRYTGGLPSHDAFLHSPDPRLRGLVEPLVALRERDISEAVARQIGEEDPRDVAVVDDARRRHEGKL